MSAYIVPFDHTTSGDVVPGLNAAELWDTTPTGEKLPKAGTTRTFFNTPTSKVTAVSSLGEGFAKKSPDAKRELVRKSVGGAVKELKAMEGLKDVVIDASLDPHAAGIYNNLYRRCKQFLIFPPIAVAAQLALYKFTLKTSPPSRFNPNLKEPIPEKLSFAPVHPSIEWDRGVVYGQAQNLARTVRLSSKV